jgi:methanogenic corrinoid protein MtbC1
VSCAITGVTPAKGSPFGGQVVTITGTGFGTTGSVTVEGRTAAHGAWTATSVTITIPERQNGAGTIFGGATVSVVLTAQDASTASTSYEYAATQVEKAFSSMAVRIGQCTIQGGYFHDIGADQVRTMKEDQSIPTGAGYPQIELFIESIETVTDEPYDHNKDTVTLSVYGVKPCVNPQSWNVEALLLDSDLRRAVMRDRGNSGTCNTTTILSSQVGRAMDNAAGALCAIQLVVQIEVPSIVNDMTTNTVFDSNLT